MFQKENPEILFLVYIKSEDINSTKRIITLAIFILILLTFFQLGFKFSVAIFELFFIAISVN